MIQSAAARAADGKPKVRPKLWAPLYTSRALAEGRCLPCVYAILPGNPQRAYAAIRGGEIRALVGEGAGAERLVALDFERPSLNFIDATPPYAEVVGCYFYLGQSVFWRQQGIGIAAKFRSGDEFKIRVKKLTALAFLSPDFLGRWI